ncbi:MAG: HlyD family efflux transporter periplasmic adaptor subunit [Methylococcales bacterium]|nr:HlyD family efflux transporter periplasmic adaptor subunit [Methylococcales bacterium]
MTRIRPREIIRQRNRRLKFMGLVLLFSGLASMLYWWQNHRDWVSTDDAFVAGYLITVKSQTPGTVVEILAENTQHVEKGDLLVKLDGSHAMIALQQAKAELAETVRHVVSLQANAETLKQRIAVKHAALNRVRHDLKRLAHAAEQGAASLQQVENARDKITELDASIRESRAERKSVLAQLHHSTVNDHPSVEKAKSRLRRAFLDFQRRRIIAPVSGYVGRRKVHVGDNLQAGAPLLTIVPLDRVWVEAHFLETQIADIRIGQPAEIRVDAYQDPRLYRGRVEGLSPATGSTFALLPADNSTGNFIHIAERLTVRIALDADQLRNTPLQPGLSTLTRVKVNDIDSEHQSVGVKLDHEAYRTDIYDHELAGAEALIAQIVAANAS